MLGQDHATQLYSHKNVNDMIYIRNEDYLSEVVKWADVFDEILPNNELSGSIVTDRVPMTIDSLVTDRSVCKTILEGLFKEYY